MLVLGALLLCLSAATTGYELRKPFKFEGKGTTMYDLPIPRPVPINATLYISNILEVSESKQMVNLEATFTFSWIDTRYKPDPAFYVKDTNFAIIEPDDLNQFWTPDIIIDQVKVARVPTLMVKPVSIRLYNDSRVVWSKKMNFDVACLMKFHHFPFDTQHCEIKFHSYGYTVNDYTLKWDRDADGKVLSSYNENITLDKYDFNVAYDDEFDMGEFVLDDESDAEMPGLKLKLNLMRIVSYFIVQLYIPSGLFVLSAYITLFMPPTGLVARSGVPVMVLFALFSMNNGTRANVPRVSYATMADIWFEVCMVLVFLTIFEFCLFNAFVDKGYPPAETVAPEKQARANQLEVALRIGIPAFMFFFALVYFGYVIFHIYS